MVTYECFKGLADPVRRAIIGFLSHESLNVSQLAARFDISRPAISRHLKVLRESELVLEVQNGRERTYSLDEATLETAAEWLRGLAGGVPSEAREAGELRESAAEAASDWRQW